MPYWVCGAHADGSTGTLGGAPCGATKRCTGLGETQGPREEGKRVTKRCIGCGGRMRTIALGPSVGFPMGPRNVAL
eukprot:8031957-Pyramimonas_sp.AAC.1